MAAQLSQREPASQVPRADLKAKPVAVPQSEELALRSKAGLRYRIFVYRPSTPPPPEGYPVIYALDGNAWFEPLAHAVRLQARTPQFTGVGPAVVVGIAYPGDAPFNTNRRFFDFVPDMPLQEPVFAGIKIPKTGGADQFLGFIRGEIEPIIRSRVRVNAERSTLFGHSLGCTFALYVLFTQPEAFDNYVCGSASVDFNGSYILDYADRFAARLGRARVDAHLLLYVAEYEEKLPPQVHPSAAAQLREMFAQARIVSGMRKLHRKIEPYSSAGLRTTWLEIPGENHISEVPVLINRMLPLLLRPAEPR